MQNKLNNLAYKNEWSSAVEHFESLFYSAYVQIGAHYSPAISNKAMRKTNNKDKSHKEQIPSSINAMWYLSNVELQLVLYNSKKKWHLAKYKHSF